MASEVDDQGREAQEKLSEIGMVYLRRNMRGMKNTQRKQASLF